MKVLFLTKDFDHYSSKYRVIQYLDSLRRRDVACTLERFPESVGQWITIVKAARRHDILFLQKKKLNAVEMTLLNKIGRVRIVYDIDDAVMFSTSKPDSVKHLVRFEAMARRCAMITAGNSFLVETAARFTPNVRLIPNGVDLSKMPVRSEAAHTDGPVTIGWNGGPKSLKYLRPLLPILKGLRAAGSNLRLKIVSQEFIDDADLPIVQQPWSEERYAEDVGSFDIAVSPLDESPQAKGKCAAKLLHYMARGVPTVSSAVGAHLDIIRDGQNGFLAATESRWEENLTRLINDPALRSLIGLAGRKTIEEGYTTEIVADRLAALFHEVAGRRD